MLWRNVSLKFLLLLRLDLDGRPAPIRWTGVGQEFDENSKIFHINCRWIVDFFIVCIGSVLCWVIFGLSVMGNFVTVV